MPASTNRLPRYRPMVSRGGDEAAIVPGDETVVVLEVSRDMKHDDDVDGFRPQVRTPSPTARGPNNIGRRIVNVRIQKYTYAEFATKFRSIRPTTG